MRKMLLSLAFSCFGIYAMGQAPKLVSPNMIRMSEKEVQGFKPALKSTPLSRWFDNFNESRTTGFENYTLYNNTIFSDSTVQVLYGDGNGGTKLGYVFTQGVGEVFDPKSVIYDTTFSRYNNYTVDSVAIPYLYNYVADSTAKPDTLVFQFYTGNSGGITTGRFTAQPPSFPSPEYYAVTKYDYKKNLGTLQVDSFRYVLTPADSQTTLSRIISVPTNHHGKTGGINVKANDLFAFTMSYRPGFKYKFGDTIDEKSTTLPSKLHSHFKILIGNTSSKDENSDYEMSLSIVSSVRYNTNTNGWNATYIPGSSWLSYNQILWSLFHVTTSNYGIEDAGNAGYALGSVYPNPVHGTASFDFKLPKTENVNIAVYDLVGHQVATLANGSFGAGNHTINFDTQNLKSGLYLYSINAGSYSKTLKFTVSE